MEKELYAINKEAKRIRDLLNLIYSIEDGREPDERWQPIEGDDIQNYELDNDTVDHLSGTPVITSSIYDDRMYPVWAYESHIGSEIARLNTTYIHYDDDGVDPDGFTEEDHEEELDEMNNAHAELLAQLTESREFVSNSKLRIAYLYRLKQQVLEKLLASGQASMVGYHAFIQPVYSYDRMNRIDEAAEDMEACHDDDIDTYNEADAEQYTYRQVISYNGFQFHGQIIEDDELIGDDLGAIHAEISSTNELNDCPTVDESIKVLEDFLN